MRNLGCRHGYVEKVCLGHLEESGWIGETNSPGWRCAKANSIFLI
jgi:hypothetical protein